MAQQKMMGGITEAKEVTEEVQDLVDQVKAEVESAAGTTFDTFNATHYSTQVVSGVNYFVKVDVGNDKFIHVRIYKHFQGNVTYSGFQDDKTKDDPITYF
ncbi:cystatin-A-like [Apostichopus japonicus]|uniref:cystatin-A-like n=1 Tax=Stichopus japonicus TaxID=307972 RepID=UPI003AB184C4